MTSLAAALPNRTGSASTATVTTVTAEVRTLTVGSRQITMSVANQLDHAPRSMVEPMGRVRLKDRVELIGRHTTDGTLVLARMYFTSVKDGDPFWVKPPAPFVVCSEMPTQRGYDQYLLDFGGTPIEVPQVAVEKCKFIHSPHGKYCSRCKEPGYQHSPEPMCAHWSAQGQDDYIVSTIAEQRRERDAEIALMRHDEALPLIVLAGLR